MSYPYPMTLTANAAVMCLAFLVTSAGAQQINIRDVGNRSQLFIDQDLVYESKGVAFTPHPARKHPSGPLLRADQPWEGWYVTVFTGTVLFDDEERVFKMWYTCPGNPEYFDSGIICYALSGDGIVWKKPAVGTLVAKNGKPHNAVSAFHGPSVFKDTADADPSKRYKMLCHDRARGYMAQVSPDGLHWRDFGDRPIVPISYVDDVISAFRDHRSGRFVALPKMTTPIFCRQRRTIYLSTSRDFMDWTKPELAFAADRRDDLGSLARIGRARPLLNYPDNWNVMRTEFYGAGAYSVESCVVGFPWVFTINANVKTGTNQEGPIETQLAVSRDLEQWHRPFRTPILPPGKPGDWDGGMILTASQAIDVGDEVRLYYGGTNYTHGAPILHGSASEKRGTDYTGAIGLATWQRDRFVSADATDAGTLTTVPIRFTGQRLELNASTAEGGEIRVEMLDAAGRPLEGTGISETVRGDSLRHAVRFSGLPDLKAISARPICLRFHLRHASLFSFAFREK